MIHNLQPQHTPCGDHVSEQVKRPFHRASKDLSITRDSSAEADDGGREMDESQIAVVELLETNEELAEAVEPTMGGFDDPPSVLGRPASSSLARLADARVVAPLADGIQCGLARVPAVGE